jgi:hypothetical protein
MSKSNSVARSGRSSKKKPAAAAIRTALVAKKGGLNIGVRSGKVTFADVTLAKGSWIIQAKSSAGVPNDPNPGRVGLKMSLLAESPGANQLDVMEIDAGLFSAMVTVVGIKSAKPIRVRLLIENLGPKSLLVVSTTVTAIPVKALTLLTL